MPGVANYIHENSWNVLPAKDTGFHDTPVYSSIVKPFVEKEIIVAQIEKVQAEVDVPAPAPAAPVQQATPSKTEEPVQDTRHSEYIKLVGLPFQCKRDQVLKFVQGYQLYPTGETVFIMKDKAGRDAGKAMVRLCSEEEAKRAAKGLHRNYMEWRYIEVYHVGEREVGWYSLPQLHQIDAKGDDSRAGQRKESQFSKQNTRGLPRLEQNYQMPFQDSVTNNPLINSYALLQEPAPVQYFQFFERDGKQVYVHQPYALPVAA
jgi:hypothetical protein